LTAPQVRKFLLEAMDCASDRSVLYICGVPGTGKTASVMEVLGGLRAEAQQKGAQFVAINCLQLPSPAHVYSKVWERLTGARRRAAAGAAPAPGLLQPSPASSSLPRQAQALPHATGAHTHHLPSLPAPAARRPAPGPRARAGLPGGAVQRRAPPRRHHAAAAGRDRHADHARPAGAVQPVRVAHARQRTVRGAARRGAAGGGFAAGGCLRARLLLAALP
jgi:Cdc6-like AAA superfamily ATPase